MSDDFLSNLAAQALGMTGAIRPRVASYFEPRAAGGVLRRGRPEPAEIELDAHPAPISPERDVQRPDLGTINPMAGRVMTWDIEAKKPAPVDAPPRPSLTADPGHAENAGETEGLRVPVRRELTAGPPASASPIPAPDAPGQRRTATAVREATEHSTTDDLTPRSAAIVPKITPARQDTVPTQTQRTVQQTHRPQASADSGPTIQVTIGRVEVRAMTSTPAGPARPPAAPIMTLEEYLRRKTERGTP